MPTYDYVCDACEHAFEEFQSITADLLVKCPECGKRKLRRLFGSGAAILFKGSGFYETDYRSKSYEEGAKTETTTAEKKTDKKNAGEKKTDKKNATPAEKPDKKPKTDAE